MVAERLITRKVRGVEAQRGLRGKQTGSDLASVDLFRLTTPLSAASCAVSDVL